MSAVEGGDRNSVSQPKAVFRHTLNQVKKEKTWVSPFRQQKQEATLTEQGQSSPKLPNSTKPESKAKVESEPTEPQASKDATAASSAALAPKPKVETKSDAAPSAAATKAISSEKASEKKPRKVVETVVDLGGGLKMPQSKIEEIAKARLAKDIDAIDSKAAEQARLSELKNQKKRELQDLKDQNKVNFKFNIFKKKLDSDKKTILETQAKQKELEASVAEIDKRMKLLDEQTLEEIEEAKQNHTEDLAKADDKLVEDKEQHVVDTAALEGSKNKEIHDAQVSQKKNEIVTRVLQAKKSEYELNLELLQLQLNQKNRVLSKQKDVHTEVSSTKEEIEAKINALKATIAENDELIKQAETEGIESTNSLKAAEEDLETAKGSLEKVRVELASVRAAKSERLTRLHDAETKRKNYEEEQERLRKEAEEKAKREEEERQRKAEEERKRLAEEQERKRKEAEEAENARIAKEAEDARLAKEAEDARIAKEAEDARVSKEAEDARIAKEAEETKNAKKAQDAKTAKDAEDANNAKDKSSAIPVVAATAAVPAVATSTIAGSAANTDSVPELASKTTSKSTGPPSSSITPEEGTKKKKRFSGFFSFNKDKDKSREKSPEKEENKSKKSKNSALAATGGLLVGTGAAVGTAAAVAGSGASGALNASGNLVSKAANVGSLPKDDSIQVPTTQAPVGKQAIEIPSQEITPKEEIAPSGVDAGISPVVALAESDAELAAPIVKATKDGQVEHPVQASGKNTTDTQAVAETPTKAPEGVVEKSVQTEGEPTPEAPAPVVPALVVPALAVPTLAVPTLAEPTSVEKAPVEQTPVEKAPVEQTPVEKAPVEQTPVEPTPAEPTPVEPTPVQKASVEQAPVEPTPVEQAPIQKAPVEPTPVEQAPNQKAPVEQTPAEPTPANPALEISPVSDNEIVTHVVNDGDEQIVAIHSTDPGVVLEEISPEEAKHEDNVIAAIVGRDAVIQEISPAAIKPDDINSDAAATSATPPQTAGPEGLSKGTYTEPAPVEIPEDQKFTVSENATAEQPQSKEAESSSLGGAAVSEPEIVDFSGEDAEASHVTSSRESTPESGIAGKSRNAKKNARKRAAAKRKKALASAGDAGAALDNDGVTSAADEPIVGPTIDATAASEPISEALNKQVAAPATEEGKTPISGNYDEPRPVGIPAEQKFVVAPGLKSDLAPPQAKETTPVNQGPEDVEVSESLSPVNKSTDAGNAPTPLFSTLDPKHIGEPTAAFPSEAKTTQNKGSNTSTSPDVTSPSKPVSKASTPSKNVTPKKGEKQSFIKRFLNTHSKSGAKDGVVTGAAAAAGAGAATAAATTTGAVGKSVGAGSQPVVTNDKPTSKRIGSDTNATPSISAKKQHVDEADISRATEDQAPNPSTGAAAATPAVLSGVGAVGSTSAESKNAGEENLEDDDDDMYSIRHVVTYEYFSKEEEEALYAGKTIKV